MDGGYCYYYIYIIIIIVIIYLLLFFLLSLYRVVNATIQFQRSKIITKTLNLNIVIIRALTVSRLKSTVTEATYDLRSLAPIGMYAPAKQTRNIQGKEKVEQVIC